MVSKLAILNLLRNKRRTLVMLLTITLGIGALFFFDGLNHGVLTTYRENTIHFRWGHGQLNTRGYRENNWEKPWEHWMTATPDFLGKIRSLPGVSHVFPRIDFYTLVTNGQVNIAAKGTGVDGHEEAEFFDESNIIAGSNLRDQPDGALIGVGLANSLNAKVGSRLTLFTNNVYGSYNGVDVTVVGIFQNGIKELDDRYFRMQRQKVNELLETDKIESIAIGLKSNQRWEDFARAAESLLPDLEPTSFEELDKFYYQNSVIWLGQQFRILMTIILIIVLLGIVNLVSFTILERTREIGNLRANGESSFAVMKLFFQESLLTGIIGGVLGIILTYIVNELFFRGGILMPPPPGLTKAFLVKVMLRPEWAIMAVIEGIIVALFATIVASWRQVCRPIAYLIVAK